MRSSVRPSSNRFLGGNAVLVLSLTAATAWLVYRACAPSATVVGEEPPVAHAPAATAATKEDELPDAEVEAVSEESDEPEAVVSEEERMEAAEETQVEVFEALTDQWAEPVQDGVAWNAIAAFAATFRAVPRSRRDECIQRALNLIPDENVMLLTGVLMDKTLDPELRETVFHDILNRDESVKMPILRQILKDKTHPCWDDAKWLLDMADER